MPNNRQKNKKKNNKKINKNKSNQCTNNKSIDITNQNKCNQSQQNEHQQSEEQTISQSVENQPTELQHDQLVGSLSDEPTVDYSNKHNVEGSNISTHSLEISADVDDDIEAATSLIDHAEQNFDDTVFKENATQENIVVDVTTEANNRKYISEGKMGTKNSKELTLQEVESSKPIRDDENQLNGNEGKTQQVKVIIHRIVPEMEKCSSVEMQASDIEQRQANLITHTIAVEEEPDDDEQDSNETNSVHNIAYQVQSPSSNDESFEKAIDDNDRTVQIQEVFNEDDSVNDEILVEQDTTATLTSNNDPTNDDYKLKRAQKRVALETHFLPQLLSPRYLDSILEENSDLSDCSDRPSIFRTLSNSSTEADVGHELKTKKANAKFPRSQLDFSKSHKHGNLPNTLPMLAGPICEEPLVMMVEAKLIEQFPGHAQENCTTLTFQHLEPQSEAAEVIFINSSTSSSTSDLMDLQEYEETNISSRETIDLDTDVHEIIAKPVENIVAMTLEDDLSTCSNERETTPVNNTKTSTALNEPTEQLLNETDISNAMLTANDDCDHLNSDEQISQCSTETIVDALLTSSSGHESSTSELPQTADTKSFAADDSSVFSTTSFSDSSIVDASVEDSSSAEAFARLEETCREIMDNVREIVYENNNNNNNNMENSYDIPVNKPFSNGFTSNVFKENITLSDTNGKQKSLTPPPIPPPPQLDTYSCSESAYLNSSNLYAKPSLANQIPSTPLQTNCVLERQESVDSHCSSSTNHSQCTTINVASTSNQQSDVDVTSQIFPDNEPKFANNARDLLRLKDNNSESIQKLRQLCTQKLASLPYGEQVLIELATLAKNIGNMPIKREKEIESNLRELESVIAQQQKQKHIQSLQEQEKFNEKPHEIVHKILIEDKELFKKTESERKVTVTNVDTLDDPLRKNLTPSPPPLPPPPVPMKSSETVAKAQQQQQQTEQSNKYSRIIPIVFEQKNDAIMRNVNAKEQKTTFTMLNDDDSNKRQQQKEQELLKQKNKYEFATKTSSVENNSRQKEYNYLVTKEFNAENHEEKQFSSSEDLRKQTTTTSLNNLPLKNQQPRGLPEMQSVENEIGRMFPSLGSANIFDETKKRFSNIESTAFPIINPKRYSNIETTSYEAQKRIENGKVVYDFENKKHELCKEGDEVDACGLKSAQHIHDVHIDKSDSKKVPENMRSTLNLNEHAQSTKNIMSNQETKNTGKTRVDEQKLFKDFDDLSQQLHHELESGRQQREQREKSASLFDLSRINMKLQLEELNKKRFAHLDELEQAIEKSAKSREFKRELSYNSMQQTQPERYENEKKVHQIPIKVEHVSSKQPENNKSHVIPINIEGSSKPGNISTASNLQHDIKSPFRRTESLYNLSNSNQTSDMHIRPRTASSNYEVQQQFLKDEWSQYPSDIESCGNISRSSAYEAQRLSPRPNAIRAPRLSMSSHDLFKTTFDPHNAYNVPRSQQTSSTSLHSLYERDSEKQTQSTSCYSVLQRDPNPTYISTTSRRGVSPAPVQAQTRPNLGSRRASLPHEIHEQQLKYITSKEEELRMEFERLQNERRRLMEEMQREQAQQNEEQRSFVGPQVPPRAPRDRTQYRVAPKMPTLSEEEVLRQQMAEEWLNKVAEREERRLQKIIKISKIHEGQEGASNFSDHLHTTSNVHDIHKPDISREFLDRVKERRHKLHMPADSDWESGAESQPTTAHKMENTEPEIKVMSGKAMGDLHSLPQHLKEFARYSNQHTEQLENGGKRSVIEEEEKRQEATPNSSSSTTKKSTIATTIKIARQPPQTLAPGQGECLKLQETAISKNINTTVDLLDHASTSSPAVKNNSHTNGSLVNSSSPFPTTNNSSTSTTGIVLGTVLVIGMGALSAWIKLA